MIAKIVAAFKVLDATRAASRDIFKVFDRVRQNIVFQKLKLSIYINLNFNFSILADRKYGQLFSNEK